MIDLVRSLPLAEFAPFVVQRVRTQTTESDTCDNRIVCRLFGYLNVYLIVRLLEVDIICERLCHETTVGFGLANWWHEAIREAQADSLQVLAIVTFHKQVRQFKLIVLIEDRQVAFLRPLEAQLAGVGMRAKHFRAPEGVKTDQDWSPFLE